MSEQSFSDLIDFSNALESATLDDAYEMPERTLAEFFASEDCYKINSYFNEDYKDVKKTENINDEFELGNLKESESSAYVENSEYVNVDEHSPIIEYITGPENTSNNNNNGGDGDTEDTDYADEGDNFKKPIRFAETEQDLNEAEARHAEQMYLEALKGYLLTDSENGSVQTKTEPPLFEDMTCIIECSHCETHFSTINFKNHICEFDKHKVRIKLKEPSPACSPIVEMDTLDTCEPDCIRLLRENQTKIRRFIKEEINNCLGENNGSKKYQQNMCALCRESFSNKSELARHIINHRKELVPLENEQLNKMNSSKILIKCTICGCLFFDSENAIQHMICHSFSIEPTSIPFSYQNLMDRSITSFNTALSGEEVLLKQDPLLRCLVLNCLMQCEFCDYLFDDVTNLFNHSQTHNPTSGYECSSCVFKVQTLKEFVNHSKSECVVSKEKLLRNYVLPTFFVCNVCEEKFSSVDLLYTHRYAKNHLFQRLNGTTLQTSCELCGDVFELVDDLLCHRSVVHQNKPQKAIVSKFRRYLCEICGKSYTQSSHLWQHLRFHKGIKPFICQVPECQRRFTIRPDLNDHIRKCHTGERPYECLVCGKRFLTGSVFYQHRLIHRNERRYGCEECGKRFYRADALKNHSRIHTGEKPFSCIYCLKSFRQQGDREKHLRARHSNIEANAVVLKHLTTLQNSHESNSNVDNTEYINYKPNS